MVTVEHWLLEATLIKANRHNHFQLGSMLSKSHGVGLSICTLTTVTFEQKEILILFESEPLSHDFMQPSMHFTCSSLI